jgi:hypothetical protein
MGQEEIQGKVMNRQARYPQPLTLKNTGQANTRAGSEGRRSRRENKILSKLRVLRVKKNTKA